MAFSKKADKKISVGLRINPECSTQEGHEIYDPCAPGSRLGITREALDKAIKNGLDLSRIEGFHFHTLCEQDSDALETTLAPNTLRVPVWSKVAQYGRRTPHHKGRL